MSLTVALTGGIGSGKSAVSSVFRSLGVPVIDMDAVCHRLLEDKTGKVFHAVLHRFGSGILGEAGSMDRSRLAARVFVGDSRARRDLESLLHPAAHETAAAISSRIAAPYHVVCIPLLVEAGGRGSYDRILAVRCPADQRVRRVIQRGGLTRTQIDRIIETQASDADRRALADDEMDNSGDPGLLRRRVIDIHGRYLAWATGHIRQT